MKNRIVPGLLAFLATACATTAPMAPHRERVDAEVILPLGAPMIEARDHERIIAPAALDLPMPRFPGGASGDIDARICAELVVAADGSVESVTQVDRFQGCEPADNQTSALFFPAVATALRDWQFFAGARCTYLSSEDECDLPGAPLERMAMKLAFSIHFLRSGGVESVSRDPVRGDGQG